MEERYRNRLIKILGLHRRAIIPGEKDAAKAAFIRVWEKVCPGTTPNFEFDKIAPPPRISPIYDSSKRPQTTHQANAYKSAAQQSFERWSRREANFLFRQMFSQTRVWLHEKDVITTKEPNNYLDAVYTVYDRFKCPYCATEMSVENHWQYTAIKCIQCSQGINLPKISHIIKPKKDSQ